MCVRIYILLQYYIARRIKARSDVVFLLFFSFFFFASCGVGGGAQTDLMCADNRISTHYNNNALTSSGKPFYELRVTAYNIL